MLILLRVPAYISFWNLLWKVIKAMKMGLFKKTKRGEVVPEKVPAMHFTVYVGDERRRFVLNTKMLNNIEFWFLLHMAAEDRV